MNDKGMLDFLEEFAYTIERTANGWAIDIFEGPFVERKTLRGAIQEAKATMEPQDVLDDGRRQDAAYINANILKR